MPYLFTGSSRLAPGNYLDSMAWAVKITEKVNTAGDLPFSLWTRVFSPGVGSLAWGTIVENVADLQTNNDKLAADGGFIELIEEGAKYGDNSGIDDALINLIHGDPGGPDAQFASLTTAVIASGQGANAIALGVEIAQKVKAITGQPTSFGDSVTGPFGEVLWISMADTIDQVQAAGELLGVDPAWKALIDEKAGKAYAQGSGQRWISRKIM
jgi:hypothetical protein